MHRAPGGPAAGAMQPVVMAPSTDAISPSRLSHERWLRRARHAWFGVGATMVVAFVLPLVTPAFDDIRVLGMRFGFFMAAQGVVFLLLLLMLWSNRVQSRIQAPEDRSSAEL